MSERSGKMKCEIELTDEQAFWIRTRAVLKRNPDLHQDQIMVKLHDAVVAAGGGGKPEGQPPQLTRYAVDYTSDVFVWAEAWRVAVAKTENALVKVYPTERVSDDGNFAWVKATYLRRALTDD